MGIADRDGAMVAVHRTIIITKPEPLGAGSHRSCQFLRACRSPGCLPSRLADYVSNQHISYFLRRTYRVRACYRLVSVFLVYCHVREIAFSAMSLATSGIPVITV